MNNLLLNEFDEKIHQITPKLPEEGWIRTIRKCLGMTTKQLAKRLGVNRSRVTKIEQAEPDGAITLRTLQEVAEALNCRLVYTLVPEDSLQAVVKQQAREIVLKRHPDAAGSSTLMAEKVAELLSGPSKHLWEQ